MNQEVVFSGVICKCSDDDSAAAELTHGRQTDHARSSYCRGSKGRNMQPLVSITNENAVDSGAQTQGLKT